MVKCAYQVSCYARIVVTPASFARIRESENFLHVGGLSGDKQISPSRTTAPKKHSTSGLSSEGSRRLTNARVPFNTGP